MVYYTLTKKFFKMIDIEFRNKEFATITVDGQEWKEVYRKRFRSEFSQIKAFSSLKGLEEGFPAIEQRVLERYVQNLLNFNSYFTIEVKEKLERQQFTSKAIDKVLHIMTKYGYLDDDAYKKRLIRSYQSRGYGARLIEQKLRQKLKRDLIEEPQEICSDEKAKEMVKKWLKKRGVIKDANTPLEPKEKQKQIAFLLRKGFSYDIVYEILFDF